MAQSLDSHLTQFDWRNRSCGGFLSTPILSLFVRLAGGTLGGTTLYNAFGSKGVVSNCSNH